MQPSAENATLTQRDDLTDSLAFFRVETDDDPKPFRAGQYLTLGLRSGERLIQRPYSIASSARRVPLGYELYVRRVPGGALTPLLFASRPGDRVFVRGPKGRFTLTPRDARTHLFLATGCGIAPFLSMLRTLRDERESRPVVLVHGVSYVRELAYRQLLERWAEEVPGEFTYVPTISRPAAPENTGWLGSGGRVEAMIGEVCERLDLAPERCVAYVCGNPEMTTAVERILRGRGFSERDVHTEEYWPLRS